MPRDGFERLWLGKNPADRAELLRARFRFDAGGFCRWCWPELFTRPWNRFHLEVLGLAAQTEPFAERTRTLTRAWAAPRGIAKTTLAKALAVHALVYGLEEFIVVLSAEQGLATAISGHVRQCFAETDTPLSELYGPFVVKGGVQHWTVTFPDGRTRGMAAKSFGTQVRGINHHGQRPTRFIVDDGERPDRVESPEQREKWQRFLDDDVLKAGPIEGGLIVDWLGTVLHPDAILARLLKSPGWASRKFKACIQWPENPELWERAGAIYKDLGLGDEATREALAQEFYRRHAAEMDKGAEMLDTAAMPLFRFYLAIWKHGLRSVLRELQNEPRDPAAQIFDSESFSRCRMDWSALDGPTIVTAQGRRVLLKDCKVWGRWDPAVGVPGGDYGAVVVLARDKHGFGYVLDAWMAQRPPSTQLDAGWALAERWDPFGRGFRIVLEGNGFQRLLADDLPRQRKQRREEGRYWKLHVEAQVSTGNKEEAIAGAEVPIVNGWLQFAEGLPVEGLLQFDDFPNGDHDDFPDAVARGWADIPSGPARMGSWG